MRNHYTPTQIDNIRIYLRSHETYDKFIKKDPHELWIHCAIYVFYRYIQKVAPFKADIVKWSKSLGAKIYTSITKKKVDLFKRLQQCLHLLTNQIGHDVDTYRIIFGYREKIRIEEQTLENRAEKLDRDHGPLNAALDNPIELTDAQITVEIANIFTRLAQLGEARERNRRNAMAE